MDRVIDELNQFLDACATCPAQVRKQCNYVHGAVDRCQAYDLDPGNVYTYSAKQILSGQGPYQVQPSCNKQINIATLFSRIESEIDDAEVYLTKDWLLKLLSKLHAIKEKAWQNNRDYQQMFVPVVLVAIEKILAKIDLIFLQNHLDIGALLEVSNFHYKREEALKSYCPKGVFKLYLEEAKSLEGIEAVESKESVPVNSASDAPVEWPASQFPRFAAVKEFKLFMGSYNNQDFVESFLTELGYGDIISGEEIGETSVEEEMDYEEWLKSDFCRWEELKKNINDSVQRNYDNEFVLRKYIGDLLYSCKGFAHYYYPADDCSLRKKEAAAILQLVDSAYFEDFKSFKEIWSRARESAARQIAEPEKNADEFVDVLYRLALEEVLELGQVSPDIVLKKIRSIRKDMSTLAEIIECALYQHTAFEYLDLYQESTGITLTKGVDPTVLQNQLGLSLDSIELRKETSESFRRIAYKVLASNAASGSDTTEKKPASNSPAILDPVHFTEKKPPKVKAVSEKLNSRNANLLYAQLRKDGYTKAERNGVDLWLKPKELYAYFCHKLMAVFAADVEQIETTYIHTNIIRCPGNLETIRSYAGRMRRGEMNPPDHYMDIDNLINEAYAGHYGQ